MEEIVRLVPIGKGDDVACQNIKVASDQELIPHIEALLECLQDLNWPIAGPVSERLSKLGVELVAPIQNILLGIDDVWKYWIISDLLYQVRDEVFYELRFTLNRIKMNPTKGERDEEVLDAVCELLHSRR